jgi:isochorismate synthase
LALKTNALTTDSQQKKLIWAVSAPDFVAKSLQTAQKLGFPLALWRLPNQTPWQMAIDFVTSVRKVKADLENLPQGFLVSPFVCADHERLFVRADFYWQSDWQEPQFTLVDEENFSPKKNFIDHWFSDEKEKIGFPPSQHLPQAVSQEDFEQWVRESIERIQEGDFQKVVISRNKIVDLPAQFDLTVFFEKLCQRYPTAFVSLVWIPDCGLWIGASPELLISMDEQKIFRTVSLAGTQAKDDSLKLSQVRWAQKEIEEQAMVSRYIINCLKKIRVREFEEKGPKTAVAGHLFHLKTDFEIDTKNIEFPQLATVMLELLHPTSAVCGMPKDKALPFILQTETYFRDWYSGYWGPIHCNKRSDIFVNLRCMQLIGNQAILYAGAGITEDSEPEKEWQETEIKCGTMLKVINDEK